MSNNLGIMISYSRLDKHGIEYKIMKKVYKYLK